MEYFIVGREESWLVVPFNLKIAESHLLDQEAVAIGFDGEGVGPCVSQSKTFSISKTSDSVNVLLATLPAQLKTTLSSLS